MKICLLSTNNLDNNIALKYWKGRSVDNLFVQIKKMKSIVKKDKI
jgi:hypothetical protein